MAEVVSLPPVPRIGDTFIDARGGGRMMRVSLHPERGVVVVSMWAGTTCRASFQLPADSASRLAELLGPAPCDPVPADPAPCDPGHPYPGLPDDEVHVTGAFVRPDLPQAS
jgi:hypothetical protein